MCDDLEGAARLLNTPQSDEIGDGGFYTLCLFVTVIKVISHLCQRNWLRLFFHPLEKLDLVFCGAVEDVLS
jgi:hypothetical protein